MSSKKAKNIENNLIYALSKECNSQEAALDEASNKFSDYYNEILAEVQKEFYPTHKNIHVEAIALSHHIERLEERLVIDG